jgi:serine protease
MTGPERVYLVFWGSQWGKESTNSAGDVAFTGDPKGLAPRLESFFKGLGTGGETWSGVMTQYCQGVAIGSTSCPTGTYHVAYPTGGAFAGAWEDTTAAAPSTASAAQIAAEAVKAATHFGKITVAANRDAEYFVVSPTGTDPDQYKTSNFCAWHDYTGEFGIAAPNNEIAFTNLPYLPDVGAGCGANFVNPGAAGELDGVTIVAGHEYAETTTDQFPFGGWLDANDEEVADKCAWITDGDPGAVRDIHFTTGTFPVQSIWSNDAPGGGACLISHPIVHNGDIITVADPGGQASGQGKTVSLTIHATDSAASQKLSYSASGMPTGLSINSATGLISGVAGTWGTFTVTVVVRDPTGSTGSAAFDWSVGTAEVTWQIGLPANPSSTSDQISGTSCASTGLCMAVGSYSPSPKLNVPLVEEWNGKTWTAQSTGGLSKIAGELGKISCPSSNYCMAVGNEDVTHDALTAQWKNGEWIVEQLPIPKGATYPGLDDVWCASATDCVAIGSDLVGTASALLAEYWNGTTWSMKPTTLPSGAKFPDLGALSCSSASSCEAVGSYASSTGVALPLAEHWNGSGWTVQSFPTVAGATGEFASAVSCVTAGTCVAVGSVYGQYGTSTPAYWRWTGTAWSAAAQLPSPSGSTDSFLGAVSCSSSTSCTAIGTWDGPQSESLPWSTSWNGSHWLFEQTPVPAGSAIHYLSAISCPSPSACVAGGLAGTDTSDHALIEMSF